MGIFDTTGVTKKMHELIPEGVYSARVYMIADMGTHMSMWEGEEKPKHTVYIGFELIGTKMSDERPFVVSKQFTLSNGKYGVYIAKSSNLHKLLKSWLKWEEKHAQYVRNIPEIMGAAASITIGQEPSKKDASKMKNTIEGIRAYKGIELAPAQNEQIIFSLGPHADDPGEDFQKLYPWMQREILGCLEFNGGVPEREDDVPKEVADPGDSDIPF